MDTHLERIRRLGPDARRRLHTTFSQWLTTNGVDDEGTKTLTAIYVAEAPLAPEDVRAFLRARLPDSVVPAEIVAVEALPKTVNGKIDRRALQSLPRAARPQPARPRTQPLTERERRMADIWSRILNVPEIDRDATFFELGGHSLLATQVIMEIERQFGLEIPLGALFSHPTVAALCRHLDSTHPPAAATAPDRNTRAAALGDAPLSHAQRQLWYASQVSDQGLEYKIVKVLDLRGRLNVAALSQALAEIVNRHESLRTTFHYVAGSVVQRVGPPRPLPIEYVDLTAVANHSADDDAAIVQAIVHRPFDLETGPLLRVTLLRHAATHVRVIFDVHHLVVDGWSFGVVVDEVNSLYRTFSAGRPSVLAPLASQYRDVARAEAHRLTPAVLDEQLAYWRRRLAGVPDLEFPRPRAASSAPVSDGELEFTLPRALSTQIAEACGKLQLTPFMFLGSVYHLLLQMHTGAHDIAMGADVTNRESKDYAGLIGFFVNQVVLRVTADSAMTFRQLAAAARRTVEEAFAHKDLPFETVVSASSAAAATGRRTPLFRAMLSFHHQLPDIAFDGIATSFVKVASPLAKYDLLLSMEQAPCVLQGTLSWRGSVLEPNVAAEMAEQYVDLCEAAVADLDAPLAELRKAAVAAGRARGRSRLDGAHVSRQQELRRVLAAQAAGPA